MQTILVADDMAIIHEPLAAALRHAGYRALTARHGVEALAIIHAQPVDLVVLDVSMPEMDGLEVLRRMKDNPLTAGIPVILLTVVSDRRLVMEAVRLGVRDYMLKSAFDMERMLGRIRDLLANQPAIPGATVAGAGTIGPGAGVAASPPSPPPLSPPQQPVPASGRPPTKKSPAPAPATLAPAGAPTSTVTAATVSPVTALKSLKPLVTRAQIEEKIARLSEIQTLSPSAAKVLQLASSQHTSLDDVVRAIRHDQAISLKILKLANSVVYTRGEPVESVRKAVMRIGLAQIRQAVLNLSIIERFSLTGLGEQFSAAQFWEHSIGCGLIAAEITHGRGGSAEAADRAFTMGLLHDLGRMIYAEQMGDLYRSVLQAANELELPLEQVESRMLLVNHADLMDRVLRAWRFPGDLITPIALHHLSIGNIRQVAPSMVEQVATLALANCLAHALLLGSSGNTAVYPTHALAHGLKLGPEVIPRVVQAIPDQTQDIKLAMLASSPHEHWEPMTTMLRQRIGAPLRPLFVGDDASLDAFAILGERLRDEDTASDPPNLGLVHITRATECVAATARLVQAESAGGVAALPLIILSPGGNLGLENSAMSGRRVQLLPYPLACSRLIAAVREVLGVL